MKTYKDLSINTGDVGIIEYVKRITDNLSGSWERAYENEENSKNLGEIAYCFRRKSDSILPGAGLSIFQKDRNIWYIPNVIPTESGQLTYDNYNEILTEFYEKCLAPFSQGVEIFITSGNIEDRDIVGEKAAKLLNIFSSYANKSTGSSHPYDRERWFYFIVEVCNSGINVDTDALQRLLQEQGWSKESSIELVIEFEFARDLIQYIRK